MHVHAIVHMTWMGVVIRTWSNEKQVSWKFLHTLLSYSFTHSTCTSPDRTTIHVRAVLWTVWMKLLVSLLYMYIVHQTCTCIATIPLHVSVDCCIMFYHVSRLWGIAVFFVQVNYTTKNFWMVISSEKSLERVSMIAYWLYMYKCMLAKRNSCYFLVNCEIMHYSFGFAQSLCYKVLHMLVAWS